MLTGNWYEAKPPMPPAQGATPRLLRALELAARVLNGLQFASAMAGQLKSQPAPESVAAIESA